MLPLLTAKSFNPATIEGGTTKPFVVNVEINGVLEPYLVKAFKPYNPDLYNPVASEVFGNAFCRQFDLYTPEAALITIPGSFYAPPEISTMLNVRDRRIKFASKFISPAYPYSPTKSRHYFEKYDIENIYAFDCLIFNADRNLRKPNILFKSSNAYLIDHEQSFTFSQEMVEQIKRSRIIYDYRKHIFYPILKKSRNKYKMFDTFREYLGLIDPNQITNYAVQLTEHSHEIHNINLIIDYLWWVKQNSEQYVQILKATLS